MIFTKLLPVAVVESAVAFCFGVPLKIFSPVQPPFFPLPCSPLGWLCSLTFFAPFYSPLLPKKEPGPRLSLEQWGLKDVLNEDEHCLTSFLKTFVMRIQLLQNNESGRTLSSTYQQLWYRAGVSVKTNPNHCSIIIFKKSSPNPDPLPH